MSYNISHLRYLEACILLLPTPSLTSLLGSQQMPQYYTSAASNSGVPAPSHPQSQRQSSTGTAQLHPNNTVPAPGHTRPQPNNSNGPNAPPTQNRPPPPNPSIMTSTPATSSTSTSFTTPTSAQAPSQQQNSMPPPPLTVEETSREKDRVSLLFEINQILLQELVNMQAQGKGGSMSAQAQGQSNPGQEKAAQPVFGE